MLIMSANQIIHGKITLWTILTVVLLCLGISEISVHSVDGATSSSSQSNFIVGANSNNGETQVQRKPWIAGVNNLRSSFARNASKTLTGPLKFLQDKRYDVLNEIGASSKAGKTILKTRDDEKVPHGETPNSIESLHENSHIAGTHEDIDALLERFINSRPDLNNNLDVITQAFRFVKLDSYLQGLVAQLAKVQESHDILQSQTVKQGTKFELVFDQVTALANSISRESVKIKEGELRIESEIQKMNHRLDQAVEKIIKSTATSHMMLDLSKESLQQMDKVEGISDEVLKEVKSVKAELGDVGQVSIQAIYNIHKLEENLMAGLTEMGNRTIYAMAAMRQEAQIIEPTVLLENGSEGNSIQADGRNSGGSGSVKKLSGQTITGGGSKAESLVSCLSRKRLINEKPRDCVDIQLMGNSRNGVYKIFPFTKDTDQATETEVYCDLETKGGGWTVIQRRGDRQVPRENFYRTWEDYQNGFGSPYNQYWLGLMNIAAITESGDQELRIELTDWDGGFREACYLYFRLSNVTDKYRLHLTDYSGSAGDSLSYHNGMAFSTKDQDNDLDKSVNCAQRYQGAWWYKNCHQSNLNGMYMEIKGKHESYAMGINWYSWHGYYYSLRSTEMKIRNRNFLK